MVIKNAMVIITSSATNQLREFVTGSYIIVLIIVKDHTQKKFDGNAGLKSEKTHLSGN